MKVQLWTHGCKMINEEGNGQQDEVDYEPYAELELFFQWPPIS